MISYPQAQTLVFKRAKHLLPKVDEVDLDIYLALNSYLTKPVKADKNYPAYNISIVDGYALTAWYFDSAQKYQLFSKHSEILLTCRLNPQVKMPKFSAVKVLTGANLPSNFLAVLKTEDVVDLGSKIKVPKEKLFLGANMAFKAAFLKKNKVLAKKGDLVTPNLISTAAGFGYTSFKVYQKPKVAIFATGDEVFKHTNSVNDYQTRDVSTPFMLSFLSQQNMNADSLGIVKDNFASLVKLAAKALKNYDVVVTCGGAAGSFKDLTVKAFEKLGALKIFYQVAVKPGKQVWFGELAGKTIFVLPGNPLAFNLAFRVYVWPFLQLLSGKKPALPDYTSLKLNQVFKNNTGLGRLVLFKLKAKDEKLIEVLGSTSADFSLISQSDGFFYVSADKICLQKYTKVPALFW